MTPRPSGRFSRSNALALALLAVGMTIFGSDKSPATRALRQSPSAPALTLDVDGGSASWDGDRREVVWDIQDTDHSWVFLDDKYQEQLTPPGVPGP